MQKRHKDLMRTLVTELRHILVGTIASDGAVLHGDLDRELERLGIAPDGTITPLDALATAPPNERWAHRIAATQLELVAQAQRASTRMEIIERAAYSWINRLLALRAMETRGLIDEMLRTNPDYDGLPEALVILRQSDPGRAAGADGGHWAVFEDACQSQASPLPGLFALDDPATALRPSTPALIRCMALVGGTTPGFTLAESDAAFVDPDAIGWAYQFYQEETKARIYAKLGNGGKAVTRSEIAAATELFTEPYMVKWLLQNSLGRSYHEIYPDSTLPATWDYYIKPDNLDTLTTFNLASLTVLDPCMGSGHFLREAFDMFVAMYREQCPTFSATEIANRILGHQLHGIDLDPRAAQLSALTLYLRARELVRDERRKERKPGPGTYTPPVMKLATTPTSLNEGALQRHLLRHPQDMPLKPLLEGIFSGLEQADILGSLIHPKEYLDNAIAELQRPHTMRLDFDPEEAELRRTITAMANHDPGGLRHMLLDRIADSFKIEAGNTDDVSAALFGREAEQGVRLLQLLNRRYAVIATNPPYMGGRNMNADLKKYIEKHYPSGKRDLHAAFILRCVELCQPEGRISMVTPHNWMFLRSFEEVRQQLVSTNTLTTVAHLGTRTFKDLSNSNALGFVLFTLLCKPANQMDTVLCLRLVHTPLKDPLLREMVANIKEGRNEFLSFRIAHQFFQKTPGNVLFYWSPLGITQAFLSSHTLSLIVEARQGLITGDNKRFLRYWWEVTQPHWKPYSKGGPFRRWYGNQELVVNWNQNGCRIKELRAPSGRQKSRPQNIQYYFHEGGTWTGQSSYGFSVRYLPKGFIFDAKGPSFFVITNNVALSTVIALTNSKIIQFVFSAIEPTIDYHEGYFMSLPAPSTDKINSLQGLGEIAIVVRFGQTEETITERCFEIKSTLDSSEDKRNIHVRDALIHTIEGLIDRIVSDAYALNKEDTDIIGSEVGISVDWYPLVTNYDSIPSLPDSYHVPQLPGIFSDYLATHERIDPNKELLISIKNKLRYFYEAGSGAENIAHDDVKETEEEENSIEEEIFSDAVVPIETFLEELSVKMQIHPISIYWLLEELKTEGARCKPEEQRLLEDRLCVLILLMLGHRWPKQLEAGEPVPVWASSDGIIPLVVGTGKATLAEQVRTRLRVENGELGIQQTEALLTELTGLSLEEWLRRRFFSRHISQFKYRPVAWHLASTPTYNGNRKRGRSQRGPAFECLLYSHACSGDALARIRTEYVEPLLRAERQKMEEASLFMDETTSGLANERSQELATFVERLRFIEEQGFACPELQRFVTLEPLDRWSGDGYLAPANRDELLRTEQAWRVDINDGVRVNIAPLQLAGALANDVLKPADAKKALADRARWRADERRWVRVGTLPRCGWMDERVPESPRWTERGPERVAEQIKLEQKRQALQHKRAEEVEL